MTRAEIVVDLGAIRRNVEKVRAFTGTDVMAVVKADAYGHGMVPSARAARAGGATWLGVATLDEALALREAGDEGPVLCWLTVPGDDVAAAVRQDIDVSVYSVAELEAVVRQATLQGRTARIQLKIDTGLSRGGCPAALWPALVARAREAELGGEVTVTGVWSHLIASEDPSAVSNAEQIAALRRAVDVALQVELRPEVIHLANSAGALLHLDARFTLIRPGLAIYGLDPAPGVSDGPWGELGLEPAMTVRAEVALVKHVEAGATVSYNGTWRAGRPTTLGLVPVGYGEGILRSASNRAEVWVAGRRRPVRGRIAMDQFVIDLDDDQIEPGAEVVLWGPGMDGEPTADDWAVAASTINYEVVTRLGGRLARRWVDS